MNPITKKYYEECGFRYAKYQEERYLQFSNLFDEISWLQFSNYLPKNKSAQILDAGCGGGGWSLRLHKMGYQNLVLLDISNSCLQGSRLIHQNNGISKNLSLLQADLEYLGCMKDNAFDFIFCERDPLEYCIDRQEQAFLHLIRILKPNGVITISGGNRYRYEHDLIEKKKYEELLKFRKNGVLDTPEGKIKPFTVDSLKTLFLKNNINQLELSGRLTIADRLTDEDNYELYHGENTHYKDLLIDFELKNQRDEHYASASSHIFIVGQKK